MEAKTFFSFGAGVQSTALWLLILHEPKKLLEVTGGLPSKMFFADTGAETQEIYRHLENVQEYTQKMQSLGVGAPPLEIVCNGSIIADASQPNYWRGISTVPLYTRNSDGSIGMLRRQCTHEYKILPLERAMRAELGYQKGQRIPANSINLWLGISLEEASRMTKNHAKWINNYYPLVELGWDRTRCYEYAKNLGWDTVKSRCFFCPYITDWGEIKRKQPEEFAKAVEFDKHIRNSTKAGIKSPVFVHRRAVPLDAAVADQLGLFEDDWRYGFENECQGYCGV